MKGLSSFTGMLGKMKPGKKPGAAATAATPAGSDAAAPAAEAVKTAPKEAARAKPEAQWRGEQIKITDGDKPKVFRAWVSSYWRFWWLVQGPTPGDIEAGIRAKWGQDGIDAVTSPVKQMIDTGKCFVLLSKKGIEQAPGLRLKHEAASRKAAEDERARKRAAAEKAQAKLDKAKTPPTAAPEAVTAGSETGS